MQPDEEDNAGFIANNKNNVDETTYTWVTCCVPSESVCIDLFVAGLNITVYTGMPTLESRKLMTAFFARIFLKYSPELLCAMANNRERLVSSSRHIIIGHRCMEGIGGGDNRNP